MNSWLKHYPERLVALIKMFANQKLKAMCNECWGIYPCPICGTDEITEEDYERELDERLNEADDWFQQHLEEELPFE